MLAQVFGSALLLASASATADFGFNIGVKDNNGNCKTTEQYEQDFDHLKPYTDTVKVYAASDCNTLQNIAPALASRNFKIFLGVWPTDDAHFSAEQEALKSYLPEVAKDNVKGVLVGSEALYRKDLTPDELAKRIGTIKTLLGNINDNNGGNFGSVPVGCVDSWNMWVDGSALPVIQASDLIMANAFSYWQGQTMDNASYSFVDDIMQALQTIQTAKGTTDVNFWVGETGWPTGGETYKSSVPGVDNAARFWQEGICAIRGWGVNTMIFEAFDESWKPDATADDGTNVGGTERSWGVLNESNGSPKYDLSCKFN